MTFINASSFISIIISNIKQTKSTQYIEHSIIMQLDQQQNQYNILVLGGTNFMGKSLLDMIDKQLPQARVVCINRGKIYWNNQARTQHKKYKHYPTDRKQHRDSLHMIHYLNDKLHITLQNKWKAVIDFSAFKWRDVQSVLKPLTSLTQRYIFISTDSIYNNTPTLQAPVSEDSFDINSQYAQQRLDEKKNDKYGYNKLKCEMYINRRCQIPCYCLRLPDVIGSYDNTERLWTTIEWLKKSHEHPIQLSIDDETKRLSFVYSLDVCRLILMLITTSNPQSDTINVAFNQNPTLKQLLQLIAKTIGIEPKFKAVKHQSNNCYPSTQFGHLSVHKLVNQYRFVPTTLEKAVEETVRFFIQKGWKYQREKNEMFRMLHKKIKHCE